MKYILIILFYFYTALADAQIFDKEEESYSYEWIWGFNKITNGGFISGLILRHSILVKNDIYTVYGVELANIHHPSEARYVGEQGVGYTFGKKNYFYVIRLQYGKEKIMARKSNQKGVQINAGLTAGPSIGLENPYYVATSEGIREPFDPNKHTNPLSIVGPGRIFQGLGNSKVVMGLNAKTSVIFEFGTYRKSLAGIEIGVAGEIFTRKIEIVPTQKNRIGYMYLLISMFWGFRK